MKNRRLLLIVLLAATLALLFSPAQAEEAVYSHLGETLADFTVATIDGGSFTLSRALAEKDMVLINLWATWCGPCEREFPYMQAAYEKWQDRVEIIALSVDPQDTADVLTAYADAHGMTFPVANGAETGLGDAFALMGIPTTVVIDRFGTVALIESGSQPSAEVFERIFDYFTDEDYTESRVLRSLPPARPRAEAADPAALAGVLTENSGIFSIGSSASAYDWPMIPTEREGRPCVTSTNAGQDNTQSVLTAAFTAGEGDALAFDFATSTEAAMDLLTITLDGAQVKAFGGEHPWTAWALPLTSGAHTAEFSYQKDASESAGEDAIWLANLRLLSGAEAAAALDALPAAPVAEGFAFAPANPDARQILFEGANADLLKRYFGEYTAWILFDEALTARAALPAAVDPEAAFAHSVYDGRIMPMSEAADAAGYAVTSPVDTAADTGCPYTVVTLYPAARTAGQPQPIALLVMADEANADAFLDLVRHSTGLALTWRYAEAEGAAPAASGESVYTLLFRDQNGAPVAGVVANICNEDTCTPMTSDADGRITFTAAPYPYTVHVLLVPAGYAFDTAQDFTAPVGGGEMVFEAVKE